MIEKDCENDSELLVAENDETEGVAHQAQEGEGGGEEARYPPPATHLRSHCSRFRSVHLTFSGTNL